MQDSFHAAITALLAQETGLAEAEIAGNLKPAAKPELGDYAFPCFPLAKQLRQAPPAIASSLAERLAPQLIQYGIGRAEAVGPYLNFFVDQSLRATQVVDAILSQPQAYGAGTIGQHRTVVVDYSSPNIAKPFHIGHLRSTVIGNALAQLFQFQGYRVVRVNHLGDWGTQFGMNIAAALRWPDAVNLDAEDAVEQLSQMYARYSREMAEDPAMRDEARAWFRKLEAGDPIARQLWARFREVSLAEFQRIYDILDVQFDSWAGEAFYADRLAGTIEQVVTAGIAEESEGALVVRVEPAPLMLRKSDGSTTYATRDLAAALYRHEEYDFDHCLYVTGREQSLHFDQVFETLRRMGENWADHCHFIGFGHIRLPEGSISTRKGNVILLEEVLNGAIAKTRAIMDEKNPDLPDKDTVARHVGVGAIIFNNLWRRRIKDFVFDWNEVLDFEGNSGPYVEYAHTRLGSIVRRWEVEHGPWQSTPGSFDAALLSSEHERALVTVLERFPAVTRAATEELEPSLLSRYLVELAEATNSFHRHQRVLGEEEALTRARLALCAATRVVLAQGMRLLGMVPVEAM